MVITLSRCQMLLLCLVCALPAQAAGPFEIYGVSPESQSAGNARTAYSDGWDGVHYNPANLAHMREVELFLGHSLSIPQLTVSAQHEGEHPYAPALPIHQTGLTIGIGYPVPEFLEDWLFLGIAIYFPSFALTHVRLHDPAKPFVFMYETQTDHYEVTIGGSVKWLDWFATGFGARLGAGQRGYARASVDPLQGTVDEQSIDAWQYSIPAPILGATLGPIGIPSVKFCFGFSFKEKVSTPLSIPVNVQLSGADAGLFVPLFGEGNFSPRSLNGGVTSLISPKNIHSALSFIHELRLSLDGQYAFWSQSTAPNFDVEIQGRGEDLDAVGLTGLLNAPREGYNRVQDPQFEDILILKTGLDVYVINDFFRMSVGYTWRPTPVPDQIFGTNMMDANVHIVSAGGAFPIHVAELTSNPIQVGFSWQTHILEPRAVEKEDPNDPVGDWSLAGLMHLTSIGIQYAY